MVVHEMDINGKHLLRISKDTVNGTTFGQIRLWRRDFVSHKLIPTKKGFGFDLSHLDDMIIGFMMLKCIQESELIEA